MPNRIFFKSLYAMLLLLSGVIALGATGISSANQKLLRQLDDILANQDRYVAGHQSRIDSLKSLAATAPMKLEEIADSYYHFQVDSALSYYDRALAGMRAAGDTVSAERLHFKRLSLLPVAGAMREALNEYEGIDPASINEENLGMYYEYGSQLYFFSLPHYRSIPPLYNEYGRKATTMAAEAGKHIKSDTIMSRYYTEMGRLINDKSGSLAAANLAVLLESITPLHPFYTRIAMTLQHYYEGIGNEELSLRHLLLTAIADVMSGTREEVALLALGEYMYNIGDFDRAYSYMTSSLQNAASSGALSRSIDASRYVPLIVAATDRQSDITLYIMAALVAALLITVAVIVYSLKLQRDKNSKVKAMTRQLAEANMMKERHIADFINLLSSHLEQLELHNKYTIRKIKAQQIDDLLKTLTSDSHKNSNLKTFYEIFDNAFLSMYPNFIARVNELRVPEKRTYDPDARMLTNDLRILAFMRLGINDSDKIARFLGVSINTIYTYRNKFRSAAINRETFEADIRAIDAIA